MNTRRWIARVAAAATLTWCSQGLAQGIGLQVADTVEARSAGDTEFSLGTVYSDPIWGCSTRAMYSAQDDFRVFFDLGWAEPENGDGNIAVQAGGIYALDVEFISDLGLRAAGYYVDTDALDMMGGSFMVLSSGETILDDLHIYGGLGADVSRREVWVTRSVTSSRGEINPAATIGLLYFVTAHVSAYVEASHVDVPMVGFGLRYR